MGASGYRSDFKDPLFCLVFTNSPLAVNIGTYICIAPQRRLLFQLTFEIMPSTPRPSTGRSQTLLPALYPRLLLTACDHTSQHGNMTSLLLAPVTSPPGVPGLLGAGGHSIPLTLHPSAAITPELAEPFYRSSSSSVLLPFASPCLALTLLVICIYVMYQWASEPAKSQRDTKRFDIKKKMRIWWTISTVCLCLPTCSFSISVSIQFGYKCQRTQNTTKEKPIWSLVVQG